jgi:hypothetical protein
MLKLPSLQKITVVAVFFSLAFWAALQAKRRGFEHASGL